MKAKNTTSNFTVRGGKLFVVMLLAALAFAEYYPVLITGRVMLPTDILFTYYPWRHYNEDARVKNPALMDSIAAAYPAQKYFHDTLASGRVPLWNPYQTAGQPFAANGLNGVFYPVQVILELILAPGKMFGVSAFIHTFLAGLFMFLMLRAFRCSEAAAVLGGVAYMLGGWMLVWATWFQFLSAAAWVPLILLFFELALRRSSPRMALFSGGALGIALLAGCPQVAAYAVLAAGFLAAARIAAPGKKLSIANRILHPVLLLCMVVATGILISAVQVFQMAELSMNISRSAFSAGSKAADTGIPAFRLLMMILPDIFGNVSKGTFLFSHPSEYVEHTAYFGAPALLLVPLALLLRRDRAVFVWFAISAAGICGAVGMKLMYPVFALPGFSMMRVNRMLFLAALSGPVLAAFAWDSAIKRFAAFRRMEVPRASSMQAALWSAAARRRASSVKRPGYSDHVRIMLSVLLSFAVVGAAAALLWRETRLQNLPREQLNLFLRAGLVRLAACAVIVAAALALARKRPAAASAFLVLALAADLLLWGRGFNPASDPDLLYPKTPSISYLQKNSGLCRIHGYFFTLFLPNAGSVYGLNDVRGYEPLALGRYAELVRALSAKTLDRKIEYSAFIFPAAYEGPLINLLGVCRLVSFKPMSGTKLVPEYKSDIFIYRNPDALPRAMFYSGWTVERDPAKIRDAVTSENFRPREKLYIEADPGFPRSQQPGAGGTAKILHYGPEEILFKVSSHSPGLLFISDPWDTGWTADVDGIPARVLTADYAFRAVPVPAAGVHAVAMRYRPASARWGAIVTLFASFLFIVFSLGGVFVDKFRKK